MRTIRTVVASLAAVSLLALPSASAVAQSEGCTGIFELGEDAGFLTSTDPRLSGDASGSGGWTLYGPASEDVGSGGEVASYIIINEDGTWECVDAVRAAPEPGVDTDTLVFAGSGDYEGLTAHIRIDWSTYPFSFSGVILEGDLPEDPELAG